MDVVELSPGVLARPVTFAHAHALAQVVASEREILRRHMPALAAIDSFDAAHAHCVRAMNRCARGELFEWNLFADDELCGAVHLSDIDAFAGQASIGYFLATPWQRRGIATRAAQIAIDYGFSSAELHRIELRCAVDNERSIAMAQRLGFTREGELRQADREFGERDRRALNVYVYGLLATDPRW